tara:strand:- start:207 stop:500 length:294 start_codon:yes stop_codon:yes gene_type:complete
MAMLNLKVKCFRCRQEVGQHDARLLPSVSKNSRYECYDCYKKTKREPLLAGIESPPLKKEYLCEKCNYRFKSKIKVCPMCNKQDYLVGGVVTVKDLI